MIIPDLSQTLRPVLIAAMLAIVTVVLSIFVRRLVNRLLGERALTWRDVIGAVAQIVVYTIGFGVIIQVTGVVSVAVLLTVLTLFTAGASLSASNLINEGLATARILSLGYYHVGDFVTIADGINGMVVGINTFSTVLKTRDRHRVIVNNRAVINYNIHVHSGFAGHELSVDVLILAPHNRKQVIEQLLNVGRDYPARLKNPEFEPKVFHQYHVDHEAYTLVIYTADEFENRHHHTALSVAAGDQLNACGIAAGKGILPA